MSSRNPRPPKRYTDYWMPSRTKSRPPRRLSAPGRNASHHHQGKWNHPEYNENALPRDDFMHRRVQSSGRSFEEENAYDPSSVLNFYGGPVDRRQSSPKPSTETSKSTTKAGTSKKVQSSAKPRNSRAQSSAGPSTSESPPILLENDIIDSIAKNVLRQVESQPPTASTSKTTEVSSNKWTFEPESASKPNDAPPPPLGDQPMSVQRGNQMHNNTIVADYQRVKQQSKQEAKNLRQIPLVVSTTRGQKRAATNDPRLRPRILQDIRLPTNTSQSDDASHTGNMKSIEQLKLSQYLNNPAWNPCIILPRCKIPDDTNALPSTSTDTTVSGAAKKAEASKSKVQKPDGKIKNAAAITQQKRITRASRSISPKTTTKVGKKNKENDENLSEPKKGGQQRKNAQKTAASKKDTKKKQPPKKKKAETEVEPAIEKLTLKRKRKSTKEWKVMMSPVPSPETTSPDPPAKKVKKRTNKKSTIAKKQKASKPAAPASVIRPSPQIATAAPLPGILSLPSTSPSPPPATSTTALSSISPPPPPTTPPPATNPREPSPFSPLVCAAFSRIPPSYLPPSALSSPFRLPVDTTLYPSRSPSRTPPSSLKDFKYSPASNTEQPQSEDDFVETKYEIDISETFISNGGEIRVKLEAGEVIEPEYKIALPIKEEPTFEEVMDSLNAIPTAEPSCQDEEPEISTEEIIYNSSMQYEDDDSDCTVDLESEIRRRREILYQSNGTEDDMDSDTKLDKNGSLKIKCEKQ